MDFRDAPPPAPGTAVFGPPPPMEHLLATADRLDGFQYYQASIRPAPPRRCPFSYVELIERETGRPHPDHVVFSTNSAPCELTDGHAGQHGPKERS